MGLGLNSDSDSADKSKSGPVADQDAATSLNSSFQNRLANASAKLRNRFKKQPGVAAAQPQSAPTTHPSTTPKSVANSGHASASRVSDKSFESAEEPKAEQSQQSNQTLPVVGSEEIVTASPANKPDWRSGEQSKQQPGELQSGTLVAGSLELSNGQLANAPPMNFDSFFQNNEPASTSEPKDDQATANKSTSAGSKLALISASFSSDIPSGGSSVLSPTPTTRKADQQMEPAAARVSEGVEPAMSLQTITKTYSTIMTSLKTRLVPLQVNSSTGVHTITEHFVITKMLTAYQTMPVGDFLLPEPLSTRSPFDLFNGDGDANKHEQPIWAPGNSVAKPADSGSPVQEEQPISMGADELLHELGGGNALLGAQLASPNVDQDALVAILSRPQSQLDNGQRLALGNLLAASSGEPLDQLGSSLDQSALLAAANSDHSPDSIQIPDLNNPLILAAAIQNPQLAAVILAAQQLRLKQQRNKLLASPNALQLAPAVALQPSYSTSFSTLIRPSTYTARDTMYTTRLVSFKDGRTVRTRTVSEPGSVIEQVLTTLATEVTPVTLTIKPSAPMSAALASQSPAANANTASTIKNALIATQLASLLARRQQQIGLQGSGAAPLGSDNQAGQLAALQQLISGQQQQQQQRAQSAKFQPNLQQLLQSMKQPQSAAGQAPTGQQPSSGPKLEASNERAPSGALASTSNSAPAPAQSVATLTSLHVRTYTVHNAFKTVYRTITSTELVTSTLHPAAKASQPVG